MMQQNKKKLKRANPGQKKSIIIGFSLSILFFASIAIFFYYKASQISKKESEFLNPHEPPFRINGQLKFIKKDKNIIIKTIDIEIADNDEKRTQGLMWHRSMPDSIGMLFIFEDETPLNFWMKNTYISLDILYVNKSKEIVTIWNNTAPLSEKQMPSEKPAQFVVEVIAGFCYNHKIDTGDKIEFEIIRK